MNPDKALRDARLLMNLHGLTGWTVKFDYHKSRAGRCNFRTRIITFSRPLALLWTEEHVRDTIKHEIAHALAGPAAGHGPAWQKIAVSIGASPEAKYKVTSDTPLVPYRYLGKCPACGATSGRHKMSKAIQKGSSCGKCYPRAFNPKFRIQWTDTRTGSRLDVVLSSR